MNKKHQFFFSIVIPTLNEQHWIPKLLNDLNSQTISDFETIIVDANSQDKTLETAKSFSNKLSCLTILSSNKQNVALQRNMGGKKATSRYILFLDADDRLAPNFLSELKRILTQNPEFDGFTCLSSPPSNKLSHIFANSMLNLAIQLSNSLNYPIAVGACIGCKNQVFQKIKFNTHTSYAEDGKFTRSLAKNGYNFKLLKNPKYSFSLRRMDKKGLFKTILLYFRLTFKNHLNKQINQKNEYPMGGKAYK